MIHAWYFKKSVTQLINCDFIIAQATMKIINQILENEHMITS